MSFEIYTESPEQENKERLTQDEVKNLSALWQEIGTGQGITFSEDPKNIREQMWQSQEKGFREIMGEMNFERDVAAEEKLQAETDPHKRALLEEQLIRKYWEQVQTKAPSNPTKGSGTTPEVIKAVGDADCQARSTMAGIALQDAGIHVERAMVTGHALLIARDSEDTYWHIDPTSIYEPTKLATQPEENGNLRIFRFNEEDRGKLQSYYSVLVSGRLEDVAVAGALGNFQVMKGAVEGTSQSSGKHIGPYAEFGKKHQDVLLRGDWYELAKKIYPDIDTIETIIGSEHDLAKRRSELLVIRFESLPEGLTIPQMTEFNKRVLSEARKNREAVATFFENTGDLPQDISTEVQEYLERVKKSIQKEDPETQEMFRQDFMLFVEHAD